MGWGPLNLNPASFSTGTRGQHQGRSFVLEGLGPCEAERSSSPCWYLYQPAPCLCRTLHVLPRPLKWGISPWKINLTKERVAVVRASLCLFSAPSWLWGKNTKVNRKKEVVWSGMAGWCVFLTVYYNWCWFVVGLCVSHRCLSLLPVVLYDLPSQARGCIYIFFHWLLGGFIRLLLHHWNRLVTHEWTLFHSDALACRASSSILSILYPSIRLICPLLT